MRIEPTPDDPTLNGGGTGTSPNSPSPVPVGPNPSGGYNRAATAPMAGKPTKPIQTGKSTKLPKPKP